MAKLSTPGSVLPVTRAKLPLTIPSPNEANSLVLSDPQSPLLAASGFSPYPGVCYSFTQILCSSSHSSLIFSHISHLHSSKNFRQYIFLQGPNFLSGET